MSQVKEGWHGVELVINMATKPGRGWKETGGKGNHR